MGSMTMIPPKQSGDVLIDEYGEQQPLPQLSLLVGIQLGVLFFLARVAGIRRYPAIRIGDLLLLAIGTHKLSRIVAKDRVTAPVRAPFTRFKERSGSGEVEEEARGAGLQGVIGELISCPYCMSVWIASGLLLLFIVDQKLARLVCKWLAMITASHFLHRFYVRLEPQ
ncbi:MAG: DUF1360 domain-containing protein [Verrucomicrobia bacterium]|nr:DUF1360 domain-containing protein [Verrucomicrobiota bacterium]MBV8485350.1 DUF1360 domain-containing protein [Verrucomicrobiota bacterium]